MCRAILLLSCMGSHHRVLPSMLSIWSKPVEKDQDSALLPRVNHVRGVRVKHR